MRDLNSFEWEEYIDKYKLKDQENPRKIMSSLVYWFYISFLYFNWKASDMVLHNESQAKLTMNALRTKSILMIEPNFKCSYLLQHKTTDLTQLMHEVQNELRDVELLNDQASS